MANEEIAQLVETYFRKEWQLSPDRRSNVLYDDIECRLDVDSSGLMYSLIRERQPTSCLEIGSWLGGSTRVIMTALIRNELPFTFVSSEIEDTLRKKTKTNVERNTGVMPYMIGDITKNIDYIPEKLDFLFVDTNHDRETTEWIVQNVWPRLSPGALFALHDWAVEEINGKWIGKGDKGIGGTEETIYLMALKDFPFKKVYWAYHNPAWEGMWDKCEVAFWEKL